MKALVVVLRISQTARQRTANKVIAQNGITFGLVCGYFVLSAVVLHCQNLEIQPTE